MIKQSTKIIIATLFVAATSVGIYSCKKDAMPIPPERAFFVNPTSGTYDLTSPNKTFKIPVGITAVAETDRTVYVSVSSSTGAVNGTHFNVPSTIVIPAGKAVDSLVVAGVYNQYLAGRKDVLVFTVTGGDGVPQATFGKTYTLNVKGPCFEGNIVVDDMLGDYDKTFDVTFDYGPYSASVTNIAPTGPTSAVITVSNVYDDGWEDLNFTIDWTDPANHTLSFVAQPTGYDAGELNAAYAGEEVWIGPPPTGSMGTFSWCDKTITINYILCIPTLGGCFPDVLTTKLAK